MLWPIAMIPYGLDFTDFGFALANAQLTWCCVESIPAATSIWLANLAAGAWLALTGGYAISLRVLWLLALWLTLLITWHTLPKTSRPASPVAPLGLALAATVAATGAWFSYNTASGLMLTAAATLLLAEHSSAKRQIAAVALAGAIISLGIFARLPNIAAWSLGGLILLSPSRSVGRSPQVLAFAGGAAAGLLAGFLALTASGALDGWLYAISMLSGMAADTGSTHGIGQLLGKTAEFHVKYLLAGSVTLAAAGAAAWIIVRASRRHRLMGGVAWALAAAAMILMAILLLPNFRWIQALGGALLILCGAITLAPQIPRELRIAGLAAVLLMELTSAGSANGIRNYLHGHALAFVVIAAVAECHPTGGLARTAAGLLLVALLSALIPNAWRNVARDGRDRLSLTAPLDHPKLVGFRTTRERAQAVNELTRALGVATSPGDDLLAFGSIPMAHFLSDTRPWLGSTWADLLRPFEFEQALAAREVAGGPLPTVLRSRVRVRTWAPWPGPDMDWPTLALGRRRDAANLARMALEESFLTRHGYRSAWFNGVFEILLPPGVQTPTDLGSPGAKRR
jgi:hypothetical protein